MFKQFKSTILGAILTLGAASLLSAGCEDPPSDEPFMGSVPIPGGLMHGGIIYAGPRPTCIYDGDTATEVVGNIVLTMFVYDNPPPPSGSATSASNAFVLPARDVFELSDCMPLEPTPEVAAEVITRGARFTWPEIALARGAGVTIDYQIRGFFDRDGDWNPFFSVRRLPTGGDVAGGAFDDTNVVPPQFRRLSFGSVEDFPEGQVLEGVAIALGALVNTELPAFELGPTTRATLSENVIPPVSDAAVREQMIFDQTRMEITLIDPMTESWANTLESAGMNIDPSPDRFAWFTLDVDADRDGIQDLHPILGSGGVLWQHPIVIMRRARNPIEMAVGIPDTLVIATVRPTQTISKQTFGPTIQIGVAPIAAVNLNPALDFCNIPYIPPGNLAETLERIPVECQEMPTGNYDINVLTGIAGGTVINYRQQLMDDMPGLPESVLNTLVSSRTENDWVIEGGSASGQAWSIPNELGCPDPYRPNAIGPDGNPTTVSQLDEDPFTNCGPVAMCDATGTNMQCSQGPSGRFAVVDADDSNTPDASDTTDGHGIPACTTAIRASTMMPDTVVYMPIPDECCTDAIRGLCGLPLCPLRPTAVLSSESGVNMIREISELGRDYDVAADGTITPRCTPLLPPASCCR